VSRTWMTADDGTTPLVEIVASEDGEGFAGRCIQHGMLDIDRRSRADVIEGAGSHVDQVAHAQVPA
jgi:hypothetical protein